MRRVRVILVLISIVFIEFSAIGQEVGKVVIRNGSFRLPKFIASLNGVRLHNEYTDLESFNYLDGTKYQVKLLLASSTTVLTFSITSEPKYVSKYILMQDKMGLYTLMLESKSLLALEPVQSTPTPTVPANTPAATGQTGAVKTNNVSPNSNPVSVKPVPVGVNSPPAEPTAHAVVEVTAMSEKDFAPRLASIKKEAFDKNKIGKAKQIFDSEVINTGQVIRIIKLMSFDDSKLDFAKWAYTRTLDQNNYYKVED
ncbi:MAG: DUF4476 domain-containing protein, partial [Flavobacteriales bacterium]|nr:DUF4476 domain-containing protein [Flavobacteriales bacterium]